eukprot:14833786-Alexandrium_andersonii.AAC.1
MDAASSAQRSAAPGEPYGRLDGGDPSASPLGPPPSAGARRPVLSPAGAGSIAGGAPVALPDCARCDEVLRPALVG